MPQFEVTITYRVEYTAVKYVRAKDEDAARLKVEERLESNPVTSYEDLAKYVGKDSEIQMDETIDIETVNELA
jgi:hypothetical protein